MDCTGHLVKYHSWFDTAPRKDHFDVNNMSMENRNSAHQQRLLQRCQGLVGSVFIASGMYGITRLFPSVEIPELLS